MNEGPGIDDEAGRLISRTEVEVGAAGWSSLCPGRARPTPLRLLVAAAPATVRGEVARCLDRVARALVRSFPHNIFADLDLLAAVIARDCERGGVEHGRATAERLVELHELYGRHSAIQFRYVHDFLYGYDWARWVQRDPTARASSGPFDAPFLAYSRTRGHELLDLIEKGDPKYQRIERGQDRNPFAFTREPAHEEQLLRALATDGWIPVPSWNADARPEWDRPFSAERERRANALGLTR